MIGSRFSLGYVEAAEISRSPLTVFTSHVNDKR